MPSGWPRSALSLISQLFWREVIWNDMEEEIIACAGPKCSRWEGVIPYPHCGEYLCQMQSCVWLFQLTYNTVTCDIIAYIKIRHYLHWAVLVWEDLGWAYWLIAYVTLSCARIPSLTILLPIGLQQPWLIWESQRQQLTWSPMTRWSSSTAVSAPTAQLRSKWQRDIPKSPSAMLKCPFFTCSAAVRRWGSRY